MSGLESCPCPLFICFAFSLASADSPFSDALRFTFGHVQQDDLYNCCTSTMLQSLLVELLEFPEYQDASSCHVFDDKYCFSNARGSCGDVYKHRDRHKEFTAELKAARRLNYILAC